MEKDLGEARLLVGQYEAKMKSLNESIKDLDGKKRSLEEQVDTLNEDVSKLKAAEQMHQVASEERQEEMQMRTALEQQISQVTTTKSNLKRQSYIFLVLHLKTRENAGAEIELVPRVPGTRKILRSYLIKPVLCLNLIK